jgi:uncharacterized protein YecE (DUF72 family)
MVGKGSGKVRIGISGWRYEPWRGEFYPEGLRQKDELAFASAQFPTIEINGTFYSIQRPNSFAQWYEETPEGFIFAVKGPRYITHIRRLKEVETPLANFFASGVLRLQEKLGPFLWQFPPFFRFDPVRIEAFFKLLPRDTDGATELAHHHDKWMAGRTWLEKTPNRPLRHAMEIRNEGFFTPEFVDLLRRYDVAMVCADTVEWPRLMDVTSDFIYCRLHGSEVLYASGYNEKALKEWTARVVAWAKGGDAPDGEWAHPGRAPKRAGRDVFVYFDNDVKVRAPRDARALAELARQRLGEAVVASRGDVPAVPQKKPASPKRVRRKAADS